MNRKLKDILTIVGISAATAIVSVWGYGKWMQSRYAGMQDSNKLPVNYAGFFGKAANGDAINFELPATAATPTIVHIKTKTKARKVTNNLPRNSSPFGDFFGDDFFGDLFGQRMIPEQQASGSGVIISADGYIVTCNHVVAGADEINITLPDKKTYKASIVGTDPSSDLAVIKIDANNLPYLVYGNSDNVKLGQWVLAVGYPLNLDVSVTAGIVSAKSRSIGINSQNPEVKNTAVEAFIQTDAAVNPGNSGGALINTNGELVGITSAIASKTGYYSGVSYAIPVNIVKKVVNDIIKFGMVQRAYIGISYPNEAMSDEDKKAAGVKEGDGVYVLEVPDGGAAKEAGIKKGDFITKLNGVKVNSGAEMVEQVARYKPGDKISVTYTRNGNENTVYLTLKNKINTTSVVRYQSALEKLGATLENVDKKTATANQIAGGVVVKKITAGSALQKARVQEGFIIIAVNGNEVRDVDDFKDAIKDAHGTIYIEGIYPGDGDSYRYPIKIDNED